MAACMRWSRRRAARSARRAPPATGWLSLPKAGTGPAKACAAPHAAGCPDSRSTSAEGTPYDAGHSPRSAGGMAHAAASALRDVPQRLRGDLRRRTPTGDGGALSGVRLGAADGGPRRPRRRHRVADSGAMTLTTRIADLETARRTAVTRRLTAEREAALA